MPPDGWLAPSSSFYWSRWTTLSAALLLASGAGTVYAFALFAPLLKSRLGLSQEDTALVASIGAFGLYTSLLAGLHFDRYGPRRTVLIGAVLSAVGFLGLYVAVSKQTGSAIGVGLIYAVAQHGSAWILSASVAAPVRNFPSEYRGTVVGLSKGFFALSASFHIEIFWALFRKESDSGALMYIAFLGIALPCLYTSCAVVFNLLPPAAAATFAADAGGSFRPYGSLTCAAAAWLVGSAYLQTATAPESQVLRWVCFLGTVGLLAAIVALPLHYGQLRYRTSNADSSSGGDGGADGGLGDGAGQSLLDEIADAVPDLKSEIERSTGRQQERQLPRRAPEIPLQRAVRTVEFWLIFWCFCTVGGTGLLVNANVAQIAQALLLGTGEDEVELHCKCVARELWDRRAGASAFVADPPTDEPQFDSEVQFEPLRVEDCARISIAGSQQLLVTLFSGGNFLGRMVSGALSDHLARRLPRPAWLALSLVLMAVAQLVLALGSTTFLHVGVFVVGVAFGSGFSMVTTLTVDCFGVRHFATNCGAVDLAPSLGSYIWASRVAGGLYDAHAVPCGGQSHGLVENAKVCWGPTCFRGAHLAAAVACVLAAVLAVLLWARTVDLYDAVVPDWLKLLARQPGVAGGFVGLQTAPAPSSKPRGTVTRPFTEAKVLADERAENDPSANRGLVSESPRSWRTQSRPRADAGGSFRPYGSSRRQQQEEEV